MSDVSEPARVVHTSSVIIALPEVASFVAPWRATSYAARTGARSGERRFPPHITLLSPFAGEAEPAALRALDELAATHDPFDVVLSRVRQFPEGAIWLVPEPAALVTALMLDVRASFADPPIEPPESDGGCPTVPVRVRQPIPHVTVTVTADPGTPERVQAALDAHGPLTVPVRAIGVWRRDSQQVWRLRHRSRLGRRP